MKKIVLLICVAAMALLGSSKVSAQGKYGPDSTECIKYLSYYTEYYKQKNYDSALPNWRKAYSVCPPTSRYSLLSDGTTLLRNLINKNAKDPAGSKRCHKRFIRIIFNFTAGVENESVFCIFHVENNTAVIELGHGYFIHRRKSGDTVLVSMVIVTEIYHAGNCDSGNYEKNGRCNNKYSFVSFGFSEFVPSISDTERAKRIRGWKRAVSCTAGWAKDTE